MSTDAQRRAVALGSLKPRGTRRLVYTSDPSNTTTRLSDPTQPEDLRQIVRNYAVEGGIDTLVQEVFAEAMTLFWRTDKCPYDIRIQHQRMVPMMDDGLMPIEVYIDECHKQGMECLAGFRMNDRHGHHNRFFEKLFKEKPEWVLRGYKPTWRGAPPESHAYGCALNFAVEGPRDWLFSLMEEVADRFDIDGIEFNYTRNIDFFPKGEVEKSHGIMTGFVRRVRKMLDEASEKREGDGKLLLGVRVPQQLQGCLKKGLDIPTWIEEGLIDYVAPSDFGFTDFNERYEDFVSLARGHDCYVYPQVIPTMGFESGVGGAVHGHMEPERYRAALRNFYAAGADGFSTQNFNVSTPDYFAQLNCLKASKSPESIATSGDRHYVFLPLWGDRNGGRGGAGIYEKEEIVLSRKEVGRRGEFRFRVCEDFPADPILPLTDEGSGLTFVAKWLLRDDEIAIDINGEAIPSEHVRWEWFDDTGGGMSFLKPGHPSCTIALSSPPFVYGDNYLGLKITKAAEGVEGYIGDIVVDRVECWVRAQSQ